MALDTKPTLFTMTTEAVTNALFYVRNTIHDGNQVNLHLLSVMGQRACVEDALGLVSLAAAWQQCYSHVNQELSNELDPALREMFARLDVLCGLYTVQVDDDPDIQDNFPDVLERAMFGLAGMLGTTPDKLAEQMQTRIDQLAQ